VDKDALFPKGHAFIFKYANGHINGGEATPTLRRRRSKPPV
jgi:hypothetical protein